MCASDWTPSAPVLELLFRWAWNPRRGDVAGCQLGSGRRDRNRTNGKNKIARRIDRDLRETLSICVRWVPRFFSYQLIISPCFFLDCTLTRERAPNRGATKFHLVRVSSEYTWNVQKFCASIANTVHRHAMCSGQRQVILTWNSRTSARSWRLHSCDNRWAHIFDTQRGSVRKALIRALYSTWLKVCRRTYFVHEPSYRNIRLIEDSLGWARTALLSSLG